MAELQSNDIIHLTNGMTAIVVRELGRGGQGIVYEVDVEDQKMALKWYFRDSGDWFYDNLENNVNMTPPSDAFLWPEYLTMRERDSFGYVMRLRPKEYHEFGQYLLARAQFRSTAAMLNAAMKICDGFKALHLSGLSYQDLNDGNFFIHPETGDVLICDNDNVAPEGDSSGILGKARYMAPEVVTGQVMPNKYTDRYSLSVILFLLLFGNHPLEGERVLACPCMTENYEKKFYGSDPVFIYDAVKTDNRPVRGVHNNVLSRWSLFPEVLRQAFQREFDEYHLHHPADRMIEMLWQKEVIQKVRDSLATCPHCGEETFVENPSSPQCTNCNKPFTLPGIMKLGNRQVILTPGSKVYVDLDNKPDVEVISTPGERFAVQLKNITSANWTVETPSGKLKSVAPGGLMPVKTGLKVNLTGTLRGEII